MRGNLLVEKVLPLSPYPSYFVFTPIELTLSCVPSFIRLFFGDYILFEIYIELGVNMLIAS